MSIELWKEALAIAINIACPYGCHGRWLSQNYRTLTVSLSGAQNIELFTHALSGITTIFIPDKDPKYRTVRLNTGHLATLRARCAVILWGGPDVSESERNQTRDKNSFSRWVAQAYLFQYWSGPYYIAHQDSNSWPYWWNRSVTRSIWFGCVKCLELLLRNERP